MDIDVEHACIYLYVYLLVLLEFNCFYVHLVRIGVLSLWFGCRMLRFRLCGNRVAVLSYLAVVTC